MAAYVELNGVRTWYDEQGAGEPLVLLHPGTSHGLLVEKPDLCNRIMLEFLTLDPVPTFAPIRRAR